MALNCIACAGACCEELELTLTPDFFAAEFLGARGTVLGMRSGPVAGQPSMRLRLDCRCPLLTGEGLCSVHETTQPAACQAYVAGEIPCLDTVRRRRTREQYQKIRGERDPSPEDLYQEGGV